MKKSHTTNNLNIVRRLTCALALSGVLLLASPTAKAAGPVLSLLNFQGALLAAYPGSGVGGQYFPQAGWTPYFDLGPIGLRLDVSFTFLKNNANTGRFLAVNYDALASLSLMPAFSLEVGPGIHNWVNNGGVGAAITANLVFWTVTGLDRVFIGYSRYFKGSDVNEFRAGVGLTI